MFSEFYKLAQNPFSETPDTKFYFKSKAHVAALDRVMSAIRNGKGFTLVTGEVGTGKTIFSRLFLNFLQKRIPTALVLYPALSQYELFTAIREEFKLPAPSEKSIKGEYDQIARFLIETASTKKRAVLIIDEAQRLTFDGLEAVRLLSNLETEERKLLQIVLIGQPELKTRMQEFELRQLAQRISVQVELNALSAEEVEEYLKHRIEIAGGANFVRFDPEAVMAIARKSRGIPRLINFICEDILARSEREKIRLIAGDQVKHLAPDRAARRFRWWGFGGRGVET